MDRSGQTITMGTSPASRICNCMQAWLMLVRNTFGAGVDDLRVAGVDGVTSSDYLFFESTDRVLSRRVGEFEVGERARAP